MTASTAELDMELYPTQTLPKQQSNAKCVLKVVQGAQHQLSAQVLPEVIIFGLTVLSAPVQKTATPASPTLQATLQFPSQHALYAELDTELTMESVNNAHTNAPNALTAPVLYAPEATT